MTFDLIELLTPERIEASGKVLVAAIGACSPLYLAWLKANREADAAYEELRYLKTGKRGLRRKSSYWPWRRRRGPPKPSKE